MKKSILLFALLFIVFASNAQNTGKKETQKSKSANKSLIKKSANFDRPSIRFETEVIDYGTIEKGADGRRQFEFVNEGTQALTILNAKSSCGCVLVTFPRDPIMPGQKAVIEARYDTHREGQFMKRIIVDTNGNETKVLTVKGNVKPDAKDPIPTRPSFFEN